MSYPTPALGLHLVRYATKGTQVARVVRCPRLSECCVVRKWLRASQRWTGEVRLPLGLVIRPLTEEEAREMM